MPSEYVSTATFEDYKTAASKTFAKVADLADYLQTEEANTLFVNKQSFEDLVQRVEALENSGEEEEGGTVDG